MQRAPGHADELVVELSRHGRLLHALKGRMGPAALPPGLDGAAFGVLMTLVRCGPRRQGELAEQTFLDPSTVSRYVAQLVRSGLVSRRPDPGDGRAVQIVATPEGASIAERAAEHRRGLIDELISTWSPGDSATLVVLLRRLNDEMEARRDPDPVG